IAVLLNITPDHLDRYRDFNAYRASKFRIFENQASSDVAVMNMDDPQVYPPLGDIQSRQSYFSQRQMVSDGGYRVDDTLYLDGLAVMSAGDVALRGRHNIDNVLAAIVTGGRYGISSDAMAETIRKFRGVEHRIEYVATLRGIDFFNDSKATNVDSAIKAVESFPANI